MFMFVYSGFFLQREMHGESCRASLDKSDHLTSVRALQSLHGRISASA